MTYSPFLLAAVIHSHLKVISQNHFQKFSKAVVLRKLKNSYVDNCVASVDNQHDLQRFVTQFTEIMKMGKFEIHLPEMKRILLI